MLQWRSGADRHSNYQECTKFILFEPSGSVNTSNFRKKNKACFIMTIRVALKTQIDIGFWISGGMFTAFSCRLPNCPSAALPPLPRNPLNTFDLDSNENRNKAQI